MIRPSCLSYGPLVQILTENDRKGKHHPRQQKKLQYQDQKRNEDITEN